MMPPKGKHWQLSPTKLDKLDEADLVVEWINKSNTYRYGFWINNSEGKIRDVTTKFKYILMIEFLQI